jgi:hypothetical protein
MAESFSFSDLTDRLRQTDGAAHAAELQERLRHLGEAVGRKLEDGVPPVEFERYRDIARALAAATKVLALAASAAGLRAGGDAGKR